MKSSSTRLLAALVMACAGSFGAPAAFAQGTFTAAASGDTCNPGGSTYTQVSCTKGSVTVALQAWGFTNATLGTTAQTGFARGTLGDFNDSGFGAYTGSKETSNGTSGSTTGQHAFDNITSGCSGTAPTVSGVTLSTNNSGCGGSIEALFLNFGSSKVNLAGVGIGWNGGDADLSVWAWTGAGDANMANTQAKGSTTTTGTTADALTGWTLVSDHNFGSGTSAQDTGGTLYSSYFLITTYFGAAGGGLDAGNDRFKIDSFTANVCTGTLTGGSSGSGTGGGNGATCTTTPNPPRGVPEPGSLALAGMALLGVATTRRKLAAARK